MRLAVLLVLALAGISRAQEGHQHHDHHAMSGMEMDAGGMVMNANKDQLPRDCKAISGEVKIKVHAGRKRAAEMRGTMFGYDQRVWEAPGCSRITVTLVNEDRVRHQWMLHGLPRYLYPGGMFHLEVNGPGERSGTFIVPSVPRPYLVQCDVPQHAEKGMKAELKVAGGDGDLPSIPGVSAPLQRDQYIVVWDGSATLALLAGVAAGALVSFVAYRRQS